jgi:hypothetical protein
MGLEDLTAVDIKMAVFYHENIGRSFLRKIGTYLPNDIALYSRRP